MTVEIVFAYGNALIASSATATASATPTPPAPDEAQSAGIREICRGAAIAAKAGESLLVTNGVALVWNACLPWVRRSRWQVPCCSS